MKLTDGGKSVTLDNGDKYYFNTTDGTSTTNSNELMTADKVTDWSKVASLVSVLPQLASADMADVIVPVKDPTSKDDQGKVDTIPTAFRADSFTSVNGAIGDSFATTATIKNVDQDGHEINGFPAETGQFDATTGKPSGPTGAVGDVIPNQPQTIPGYTFVKTDGATKFGLDPKTSVVTNHYQVNIANLTTTNKPGGTQIAEVATGDPTANTTTGNGSADASGVTKIAFTNTDATLKVAGYAYTVSVNGGTPYATLADALAANPTYDTKADTGNAKTGVGTQKFVVTYKVADKAIQIGTATKVYDGDATTDPFSYTVTLPTGLKQPTWTLADFTAPTSQNVSTTPYSITLSAQGLTDLKTANPGLDFTSSMVTPGSLTITQAPVTITAPSDTKPYDGTPFTQAALEAKVGVTGKPTKGDALVYTLDSVAGDIAVNTDPGYVTNVSFDPAKNPNYKITAVKGKLTITPVGTLTAQIGAHSKVYDGTTTDTDNAGVYDVTLTGATGLAPITWVAGDFTIQNVQPDVGTYQVVLSKTGQDKLTAAAKNYTFDLTKDVKAGSFEITPAPITITGPTDTKTFDGTPFDAATLKSQTAVDGVSGSMKAPVFSLNDVSADFNVGSYDSIVTAKASDNSDYTVKTVNGKLTINPLGLEQTPPNEPGKPTNPDEPNNNPALDASVVVQGATKVYDGDETTDPTTYNVLKPTGDKYASFVVPTFEATDFTITDLTQNVGKYKVTLAQSGIDKLVAANKNFTIKPEDIQNGLFVITPAPLTITAPSDTKVYDGHPFDQAALDAKVAVTGKPAKGDAPVYTLGSVAGDIAVGNNYPTTVTADPTKNTNYTIKTVPGNLTITPAGKVAIIMVAQTKVYDNDSTTDPTTYDVTLPDGVTAPTWTADDFDLSGITSQDVGSYNVTLSDKGISDLQAKNPNYTITKADVTGTTFTITKAPIVVNGPTLTKVYDGQPYTGTDLKASVTGTPAKGTKPVVSLGDISADVNVSTTPYVVPVTADETNPANKNYSFTLNNGQLTITPLGLEQTPPNDPGKPINPNDPPKNPAMDASVVVQGATKVYDGDATTDPTTFNVLKPTGAKYATFVMPTFDADDFKIDDLTQNVNQYKVELTQAGIDKLVAANKNFTINPEDIQNGLFTITKAPVTITAPSGSKVFDGQPYTGDLTAKEDGVPAKGDKLQYTLTDVSGDTNIGTYDINVVTDNTKNTNYTITTVPGKLTITPLGLEQTPPNEPGKPTNPNEPNNNPALDASVVVQGARKVYDNDPSNTPKTFNVLKPTGAKYASFVVPTFDASDFKIDDLTQDVNQYKVELTQAGIDKLVAANKNFTIKPEDIQNGLYVIDPAPVMVKGQSGSKIYDGSAFTDAQLAGKGEVIGKPALGKDVQFTLTDISGMKNVGTYKTIPTVAATDNPDYLVTPIDGQLSITPLGLEQTPPNEPGKPTNPNEPNNNPALDASVVVQGARKVYDNDPSNTPKTFTVLAPTGDKYATFVMPTFDASDFKIDSLTQEAGQYKVELTQAGIDKLVTANKNFTIKPEDIQNGLYVIDPAPVMVKGQSGSKVYDGSAFTDAQLAGKGEVIGKPALGKDVQFTLTDISGMKNVGTYKTIPTVADGANPDYLVTPIDGQLSITPQGLEQTPPNEPGKPTNPNEPNNNPALDASVVVQGARKVYDNDPSNTPKTFMVLAPTGDKYATFVMPTFDASDFKIDSLTQEAGQYKVELTQAGIDKLTAANKNFTIKPEDIQNGLYVIDPAPVMVKGQSGSKVYDGSAFTDAQLAGKGEVIGKPALGKDVQFTLTDISGMKNVGTYKTIPTVADGANPDYLVTPIDGQLSITPQGLEQTPPNEPGQPTNPNDPPKNPALEASVVVQGATKVYDGDATTDPTTFNVLKPTGAKYATFVMPAFDASDFTITDLTQNVGQYKVELTQSGIDKLVAANKDFTIKPEDIQNGLFTITKAPVTITAPSGSKVFDGQPYTGDLTAKETGVPAKGDKLQYTLTDVSGDTNIGTYDINVVTDNTKNTNYTITTVPGKLTITPLGLEQTPPNDPGKPTNPNDPPKNPALAASVVVQGGRKVYDNDPSTTPATFKVLGPTGEKYASFVVPTFEASDFDTSNITQNAGTYKVTLSQSGIDKLVAANKNFTINPEDIQNGLYIIDKAPVMVKGQSGTKVYDGSAFTDSQLTSTGEVIGKPALGVDVNYKDAKIDNIKNVGTYLTKPSLEGVSNENYLVTPIDGQLSITPQGLTTPPDNTPKNPSNPKTPNDNQPLATSVVVEGATKVYDGDATTDPTTFKVAGPTQYTDFIVPTLTADDFDTSGITSQNVDNYVVKLSAAGLAKIQAANPNYKLDASDVQNGLFVITPAPLTITGPTVEKYYDGQPYPASQLSGKVAGQPTKGVAPVYSLGDISGDVNVGTYGIPVVADASANGNYKITPVDGQLTITPIHLAMTPPNDPNNPVNPNDPKNNPKQDASITVQGNTKVYDGDVSTDPAATSYKVLGPAKYPDFVIPTLTADDYDLSGITSQNVDSYKVTLSAAGIAKIQSANKNYVFDASDIQNGLFVITPAPVTITAPTLAKTYDGLPYAGTDDVAKVSGQPKLGVDLKYTLTDISKDIELGNYPITVTANDNPNYKVTVVPGQLSINDTAHKVVANYVDQNGTAVAEPQTFGDLKFGDAYTTKAQVVTGYYLTAEPANANGKVGHDDITVTYVYNKIGQYQITPPDGGNNTDITYPNDPQDPHKVVTPKTGIVPNVPGYTPVGPNGDPLKPFDPNNVTKGYLPPEVPNDPGTNTPIKYVPNTPTGTTPGGGTTNTPGGNPPTTPNTPETDTTTPGGNTPKTPTTPNGTTPSTPQGDTANPKKPGTEPNGPASGNNGGNGDNGYGSTTSYGEAAGTVNKGTGTNAAGTKGEVTKGVSNAQANNAAGNKSATTLPQTNENQSADGVLGLLGMIGTLGLAGALKKRRRDNDASSRKD
ncbi:adhesion exoprotein [Secundilactobacillus pentosiphilus]|uniref:Adhesion exoprotein n=1 Tax=Secundilactobacillus pentosiphilus TaxID=1714682 RepID=A0A1Z5IXL0_9LACO|nr:MBG domain-containing protein [Secundilactobacillus pentosiphilus]GAX06409.1 adhesion exoprotein [Secundilactobacillus pentosiphilus]